MRKIYYVILDGAADRPITSFQNQTPLERARKPYLDGLAQKGMQSMIEILSQGRPPESDSGVMALLGYDPSRYYCGRGTLETIGNADESQISFADNGELLLKSFRYYAGFRINFASLDEDGQRLERRVSRSLSGEELQILTEEIREKVNLSSGEILFELNTFGGYRGTLTFYSNDIPLSGNVSNTDPGFRKDGYFSIPVPGYSPQILICQALDHSAGAVNTAAAVNEFSEKCISVLRSSRVNEKRIKEGKDPANSILVRDGGEVPVPFPLFRDKYGRSLAVYGQMPSEKAITVLAGGKFKYTKAFDLKMDGDFLTDCADRMISEKADTVLCHLKGPDEFGHDDDPEGKVKSIELIDQCFFRKLAHSLMEDDILIVTCDHATPCELGIHSGDPVPLLITGMGERDQTVSFSETAARSGACSVRRAVDIMDYVKGVF